MTTSRSEPIGAHLAKPMNRSDLMLDAHQREGRGFATFRKEEPSSSSLLLAPGDPLSPPEVAAEYDHVMIDIETMSLSRHNALLLSVGMIKFDPTDREALKVGLQRLVLPSFSEQIALGRHIDPKTQQWWKDQPDAAREHWLRPAGERWPLAGVITEIRNFVRGSKCVWANGTQFDLSNLEGLADQLGETEPLWHYRAPRDMRTFCEETAQTRIQDIDTALRFVDNQIDHHPVWDCIKQAHHVWSHWQER